MYYINGRSHSSSLPLTCILSCIKTLYICTSSCSKLQYSTCMYKYYLVCTRAVVGAAERGVTTRPLVQAVLKKMGGGGEGQGGGCTLSKDTPGRTLEEAFKRKKNASK